MVTVNSSVDQRRLRGDATREKLLDAATAAFAAKGFYGTSLRDIGGPLGLSNASMLHHFSGKSDIYAEVLDRIAGLFDDFVDRLEGDGGDAADLFDGMWDWLFGHPDDAQLLMRELLDNAGRADRVERWRLARPMHRMAAMIARGQKTGHYRACDPLTFLFHMIGSISYLAAGLPTVAGIAGEDRGVFAERYRAETRGHLLRALNPTAGDSHGT